MNTSHEIPKDNLSIIYQRKMFNQLFFKHIVE